MAQKCKSIFDNALRLAGAGNDPDLTEDYAERMRYLLACFIGECYGMDASYRQRLAITGETVLPEVFDKAVIDETEDFPMSVRFAPAAAYYVASMLVLEENPALSDRLYTRFEDALSHIRAGIPMVISEIENRYRTVA